MPRLHRPHIQLAIRVKVAQRQLCAEGDWGKIHVATTIEEPLARRLAFALQLLFAGKPYELHHRPALVNRRWNARKGDYDPPANDPDYLVYLPKDEHNIETRVRGIGAQRSDLAQRRYNKRVARNRSTKPKRKWSR